MFVLALSLTGMGAAIGTMIIAMRIFMGMIMAMFLFVGMFMGPHSVTLVGHRRLRPLAFVRTGCMASGTGSTPL